MTTEKILDVLKSSQPSFLRGRSLDELRDVVAKALDRALDVLGFSSEASAADYAGLVVELGFQFEKDKAVAAIFARRNQSAEERLHAVFHELKDEDWTRLRAAAIFK